MALKIEHVVLKFSEKAHVSNDRFPSAGLRKVEVLYLLRYPCLGERQKKWMRVDGWSGGGRAVNAVPPVVNEAALVCISGP